MADTFKINVEVEEEVEVRDQFGIEDAVSDALRELGYTIIEVSVSF